MLPGRRRTGEGLIEALLILTVAAVVVVWFAYGHLPGFQSALAAMVEEVAPALGF